MNKDETSSVDPVKTKIKMEEPKFVVVPFEKLTEDALTGLIDEFILREGTDYGKHEYTLEEKHQHVHKQLLSGQAVVVFDTVEETASLIRKEQIPSIS